MLQYKCVDVSVVENLGIFGGKRILLCDMVFVDEHGNSLDPVENVVVSVSDVADIEKYPENFLPYDSSEELFDRFSELCAMCPRYSVYNKEELADWLSV